jgi:hypothetical protein
LLFVKDRDPLGPNYVVLRDSVLSGRQPDWRVWIATDQPLKTQENPVRAKGRFDVDLVVFFAQPDDPRPSTEQITRRSGASGFDSLETSQRCLRVALPPHQPITAVLYPVRQDQPTPRFTALDHGRVVKIESSYGIDYVMLGLEAFDASVDGIEFQGQAGAVQRRNGGVRLHLPRRGRLKCSAAELRKTDNGPRTTSR